MVSLVAALLVGAPTAGAQEVPEDCAVPPDIDLDLFNVIIGDTPLRPWSAPRGRTSSAACSATT
jgi:hypothetical protein